jgi:hypothetical protein
MPIENAGAIDMATTDASGKLQLVVTDSGMTRDPEKRFALLLAKLTTCLRYVFSPQFAEEHPQSKPESVGIAVICALPPTDRMKGITEVRHPQHREVAVPVSFEVFKGRG